MIYKRYRYRIYPTKVQDEQLARHFGAVRYVYNWGLEIRKKAWSESKENVSRLELQGRLPTMKKELTWLGNAYSQSLQIALQNLDKAYSNFWSGGGHPAFKSKTKRQSFAFFPNPKRRSYISDDGRNIEVPKVGLVRAAIDRLPVGVSKTVTISKTPSGKYYASCLVAIDEESPAKSEPIESDAIGIDLGIKSFATLSTGEVIENPRHLNKSLKALRRVQRSHSKKKKGSKNKEKSRKVLARLYERVTNQRRDFLHKFTTQLARENQTGTVCIEDLNVDGMGRLHSLARHVRDASFGEFRRQLTYKADWYGINLKVIDRFAPSSKQCTCGVKNTELTLKQRSWTCAACGTTHDRDLLAAQNIVRFAFHPETVVKSTIGRGTPELTPVETLALAGQ